MMTIKFKRIRHIRKTIDYSKKYSIYEAIQLIYMLHNRALNHARKYSIEYEVFEDLEPIYRDKVQIGSQESINFFDDAVKRVRKLFNEEESEDKLFLLSKIKKMEEEYSQEMNKPSEKVEKETIHSKIQSTRMRTEASSKVNGRLPSKEFENRLESSL